MSASAVQQVKARARCSASGIRLDPCADCDVLGARLALFGKVIFIIALAFFALQLLIYVDLLALPVGVFLGRPETIPHVVGSAVLGVLWLVCARTRPPLRVLRALEAVLLIATCTAWALMLDGRQPDSRGGVLLAVVITVITRAIVVPSTAGRTLWLTAAAMAPIVVVQYLRFPAVPVPPALQGKFDLVYAADVLMWIAAATAAATIASRIIYGLAKQIAEAGDIGQYTLEQKLGTGGMGEVWRARHRMLIRPAAIKILRHAAVGASAASAEIVLRRFEREARATAALKSPHTVHLYDFGVTEDGRVYYAMELLDGLDLETLVRRYGPVPAERAVHFLQQACRSLAEAHRADLVHRDLKPANLFVMREGSERDFVKVLDFGLVKLGQSGAAEGSLGLTVAGATTGTPAYMAPEVVLDRDVDHRADIYALGCVAYWLVTGHMVFAGETAVKVMLDHVHTAPPPPSTRTELPIPAALERLILECLDKDPARRPASARELAARLGACELPGAWSEDRAERWWRLHQPEATRPRPVAEVLRSHEARDVVHLGAMSLSTEPELRP